MRFLSTATALASLGAALPSASQTSVHEKRIGEPIAWVRQDRASKDLVLPVRIGLKQANLENMYKFVDDVANPKSANFGGYPNSLFAPPGTPMLPVANMHGRINCCSIEHWLTKYALHRKALDARTDRQDLCPR